MFEDFEHATVRRDDGLRHQDAARAIDEQQLRPGKFFHADVDDRVQQHLGGRDCPVEYLGLANRPAPEEQFVPMNPAGGIVDRLARQKYIHNRLIGLSRKRR